ncbi:NET1-associated nuclear protein 1 [Malassezia sp. CBS 17886]|nr:NET1-associated nuclear protein 1 [Malassezia sp. CBS 17886]
MPARRSQSKKARQPGAGDDSRTGADVSKELNGAAAHTKALACTPLQDSAGSTIPPVFTRDGAYVFLAVQTTVLIVSRVSNRIAGVLSGESTPPEQRHTAPITDVILSPFNPLQLITCSLDGSVKTWDYLDSELHDNVHVGHEVIGVSANAQWKNRLFVGVRKAANAANAGSNAKVGAQTTGDARSTSIIYSVQLGRSSPRMHKAVKLVRLGKAREATQLQVSPDGAWLVILGGMKLLALSLHDTSAGIVKYASESRFTALAFHPSRTMQRFATGEANGKIKIWYCLESAGDGTDAHDGAQHMPVRATTTLHWHAHGVGALEYTPDGSQLLSGGEEGVLVVWRLNTGNAAGSEGREFLPRLGAGITALGVAHGYDNAEQEYVVRLADGSTVFVASLSLKPTRTFATIKCDGTRALIPASARESLPQPLALDRHAGHVALTSGHPSTLQFVDVNTRMHVRDVEIAPSNRVSRPDGEALLPTRVLLVAFSDLMRSGVQAEWMATVDGRDAGMETSELSLKLWQWDPRRKTYILNTRIDHPHEMALTALSFSPRLADDAQTAFLLVTAGLDGQMKTWHMASRSIKGGRTESFWVCRSSMSYRGTIPRHVSWSPDGSLMSVSQGVFVTLWDPQCLVMQAHLATPGQKDTQSSYFAGRRGRYLTALGTNGHLVLWDLVSQEVVWTLREPVYAQIPYGDGILAVSAQGHGSLLRWIKPDAAPACEVEVREMHVRVRPDALVNVSTGSGEADDLYLLAVDSDGALVGIGDAAARPHTVARSLGGVALPDERATLFDELFGVDADEEMRMQQALEANRQMRDGTDASVARALDLFSVPSHLLPPVASLLDPFMHALLPAAPAHAQEANGGVPAESATSPHDAAEGDVSAGDMTHLPAPASLDRIAQARDADMDHLGGVFDALLTGAAKPATPLESPTPRAPTSRAATKGKRRVSQSSM